MRVCDLAGYDVNAALSMHSRHLDWNACPALRDIGKVIKITHDCELVAVDLSSDLACFALLPFL